ncbi:MAG: cysteine dioxygenase, partial [Bacteroidia bacterium]
MSIQQETTELDQIITLLGDSDLANAAEITKQIAVPREQLEPFMFWNEGEYTRNCLARGNNYELLLLCWSEGQKTAIHCHDGQECWVKVISGSFKECIYRFDEESLKLSMLSTEVIGNNETTIMVDGSLYHSLENTNSG